jgi:hypothetical protein
MDTKNPGCRWTIRAIAGLALLAGFSGPLAAADFTFQVPLDVRNMPAEVTEGQVQCDVDFGGGDLVSGQQFFGVDSLGNFQQTISVPVTVQPDRNPALARGWICQLMLRDVDGDFLDPGDLASRRINMNASVSGAF